MPLFVFIVFLCLGLGLRQGALMDPDTGWHIAAGDLIRELGRIPETDPWSYTAQDHPWYNISWAYDVALSLLHQAGGLPAVVVATVILWALAVTATGAIALKSSQSVIAAAAATALAGFVLLPGMLARPQTVSYLIALGFYAILRFGGPKALWLLPLLALVWANAHGAFLAGFVIIGTFFIEAAVAGRRRRAATLVVVGALCAAASLVNPYGWGIIHAVQLTMDSAMRDVLLEWRPADVSTLNRATMLVGALVLLSALYERRIPLADKILACFWLAVGLSAVRMLHFAAILGAPYFAQALALRLERSPVGAFVAGRDRTYIEDLKRPVVRYALGLAGVALAVAAFAPPVQRALADGTGFASMPDHLAPDAAIDFAKAYYPHARLHARYGFGGYLVYRERGATPVFVDGRADTAYPRDVLEDAVSIGFMDPRRDFDADSEAAWRALVERYAIDGFLTSSGTRLDAHLARSAEWTRVYQDDAATLFIRSDLARETERPLPTQ